MARTAAIGCGWISGASVGASTSIGSASTGCSSSSGSSSSAAGSGSSARMSCPMPAKRSTTRPSVSCMASSVSWVRATSSRKASSAVSFAPGPRDCSMWPSKSASRRSIAANWPAAAGARAFWMRSILSASDATSALQPRRQRGVVRPLGQCQSQRVDAQRQIGEHVALQPGVADALDLVGERLHLGRQPPDRLIGGDVVNHAAQGDDRAFELAQGRGVSPPRSDRSSATDWRPRRYSRPDFPPVSVHAARRALR